MGRLTCHLARRFFGLNEKYMEQVYEQFFMLKYHGGWSFLEAYNLPVTIRRWFLDRMVKQFESEKEQVEKAKRKAK